MKNFRVIYIYYITRFLKRLIYIYYNRCVLKIHGVHVGKNVRVYNSLMITKKQTGDMTIGDGCSIQSASIFNPLIRGMHTSIYVGSNANLVLSDFVGISSSCIWCTDKIYIGKYTKIGAGSIIMDNDAHNLDYMIRRNSEIDIARSKPVIIESDVLIGANSIVLKGVTIGARSIIGAGSVVTNDIPADCIAAGNPCKVIRKINNE